MNPAPSNTLSKPLPQQSYSLSTLLLGMTVCSVWLLAMIKLPCVGVCSAIFLLPGVIRTIAGVNVRKRQGIATSAGEKVRLLVSSSFSFLAALMVYIFWLVVIIATIMTLSLLAQDIFPDPSQGGYLVRMLTLAGIGLSFLLAAIPAIRMLYLDWPRVYDVYLNRFLSEWEIRELSKWQQPQPIPHRATRPAMKPQKKRLCPDCDFPGISPENPCPVCGNTGKPDELTRQENT